MPSYALDSTVFADTHMARDGGAWTALRAGKDEGRRPRRPRDDRRRLRARRAAAGRGRGDEAERRAGDVAELPSMLTALPTLTAPQEGELFFTSPFFVAFFVLSSAFGWPPRGAAPCWRAAGASRYPALLRVSHGWRRRKLSVRYADA